MERKSSGNGRRPQLFFGLCAKSSDLPWPAGGHGLQPQLQARERAAHTGTVSEQCLEPNRARFLRQLKRISVLMDSVVRVSPPQPASPVSAGCVARVVRFRSAASADRRDVGRRRLVQLGGRPAFPAFAGRACRSKGTGIFSAALLVVGLGARSAGGSAFAWRAPEESHHQ
jgi:hypothetical protein